MAAIVTKKIAPNTSANKVDASAHADRMNSTYRHMKYVYDLSRPFFLAGRAFMRQAVLSTMPTHVCEIGSGTGRNLILMAQAVTNQIAFTGLDVSSEMVDFSRKKIAAANLERRIDVRVQDFFDYIEETSQATTFVFSYSLSMIPDWCNFLRTAARACRERGGSIVIVDFSTMERWPLWIKERLRKNLLYFHVEPRYELWDFINSEVDFKGSEIKRSSKFGGYAEMISIGF
jgi:S-adenosylmethionine-diacylgycerolhomoserine-N-methlytransferase